MSVVYVVGILAGTQPPPHRSNAALKKKRAKNTLRDERNESAMLKASYEPLSNFACMLNLQDTCTLLTYDCV